MKALIRKSPINCYEWQSETVMLEPFPQGTDEIGRPYTLEGYRYALCTNVPDEPVLSGEDDLRLDASRYDVSEHEETVPGEHAETITRKYWTATWRGA